VMRGYHYPTGKEDDQKHWTETRRTCDGQECDILKTTSSREASGNSYHHTELDWMRAHNWSKNFKISRKEPRRTLDKSDS
jgi:hypothetical protein